MNGAYRNNGELRNYYRVLIRKPKGKRPLGRHKNR
jgi:hypothetical protein